MAASNAARPPEPISRRLVRLGRRGPAVLSAYACHRLSEAWYEHSLRIHTGGRTTEVRQIGDHSTWKNYAPVPYRSFARVMRHVEVRPGVDVFVDYGAGKGRAIVLAARHPFRRVVGVEVVPEFAEEARRNIARARRSRSQSCSTSPAVEVVTADALTFGVPDDATFLHFFDPFAGEILDRLTDLIEASLRRSPRRITILYADDHHFASLADARPWLKRGERVPLTGAEGQHPERCAYTIYAADPDTGRAG